MLTSQIIKQAALDYGADLVGIGDIRQYAGTSPLHDPCQILPTAKSIVGLAMRIPRGLGHVMQSGTQSYLSNYIATKAISEELTVLLLLKLCRLIEDAGYEACPQRTCPNIRSRDDDGTNPEVSENTVLEHAVPVAPGKPAPDVLIDFARSAVICGLGSIGWRGQVLTPAFGPYQRLAYIITNAPFEADAPFTGSLCDQCGACADACPGHAIAKNSSYDRWQCSVYYRGAHRSNPLQKSDFLQGHPDREAILNGDFRFDETSAKAIYPHLGFLPRMQYGYVPCLCKRACDAACFEHMKEKGLLQPRGTGMLQNVQKEVRA
jgi:epoxyqueuosine reductase QueG